MNSYHLCSLCGLFTTSLASICLVIRHSAVLERLPSSAPDHSPTPITTIVRISVTILSTQYLHSHHLGITSPFFVSHTSFLPHPSSLTPLSLHLPSLHLTLRHLPLSHLTALYLLLSHCTSLTLISLQFNLPRLISPYLTSLSFTTFPFLLFHQARSAKLSRGLEFEALKRAAALKAEKVKLEIGEERWRTQKKRGIYKTRGENKKGQIKQVLKVRHKREDEKRQLREETPRAVHG